MRRLVIVDEKWIHHITSEIKEQFKQWIRRIEAEECQSGSVEQSHCTKSLYSFQGYVRYHSHRLPGKLRNDHGRILCKTVGPIRR